MNVIIDTYKEGVSFNREMLRQVTKKLNKEKIYNYVDIERLR